MLQSIIDEIKSRRETPQVLEKEQEEEIVEPTLEEEVVDSFDSSEDIDDEEEYDDDLEQEDVEVSINDADVPLNSIIEEIEEKLATMNEDQADSNEIVEESYELCEADTLSSSFVLDDTCVILPETKETLVVAFPQKSIIKEPIFFNLPNETYDPEFEPKNEPIEASFLDTEDVSKANDDCELATIDLDEEDEVNPSFSTIVPSAEVQLDEDIINTSEEKVKDEEMSLLSAQNQFSIEINESLNRVDNTIALNDNPYFGSRKMNFKWKPIIFSVILVGVIICLFITIFVLIMAFR